MHGDKHRAHSELAVPVSSHNEYFLANNSLLRGLRILSYSFLEITAWAWGQKKKKKLNTKKGEQLASEMSSLWNKRRHLGDRKCYVDGGGR